MVKRKKKGKPYKEDIFIPTQDIESSPKINPNATLTPEASLGEPTDDSKFGEDLTTASMAGEETEERPGTRTPSNLSPSALFAGLVLKRITIPSLLAIIVIGIIFIQDNGAGRLSCSEDMYWTFKKSIIIFGLFYSILIVDRIYKNWKNILQKIKEYPKKSF